MARRRSPVLTDPMFAVVLARVSTAEQARGESLQGQLDDVRAYAEREGFTVEREYVERGDSGRSDNRAVFRQMLADLHAPDNRIGTVLVVHTSRFIRDAMKARVHKVALAKRGIRVVSIQQPVDDDPTGHFVEGMFELIDQLESEQNGIRTRAAMAATARAGYWPGSRAPYGFRLAEVTTTTGKQKNKLESNPAEADVARRAVALYLAGSGAVEIARALNAGGQLPRTGLWDRDRVLRLLGSRALIGEAEWGRRDSRTGLLRAEEVVVVVPCPAVIERGVFDRVQDERERRDPERVGRATSSRLLLTGLLKCGPCGASCELQTSGKRRPNGERYCYYMCSRARRTGVGATCNAKPTPVAKLDAAVIDWLAERVFSDVRCREILRDLVEEQGVLRHRAAEDRAAWVRERDALKRSRDRLLDAIQIGAVVANDVADRLTDIREQLENVEAQLGKVRVIGDGVPPGLYQSSIVAAFVERLRAALDTDRDFARTYLHALVEKITVAPDGTVEITSKQTETTGESARAATNRKD